MSLSLDSDRQTLLISVNTDGNKGFPQSLPQLPKPHTILRGNAVGIIHLNAIISAFGSFSTSPPFGSSQNILKDFLKDPHKHIL